MAKNTKLDMKEDFFLKAFEQGEFNLEKMKKLNILFTMSLGLLPLQNMSRQRRSDVGHNSTRFSVMSEVA
ncbi:hypothetical protein H6501_00035 [Candidatus Woesearchaeota archaeon]|nr:hypothetical protein [Candidatus Woesearchaeota archaeon]USN44506.1 MAG: hypothetical protein H6500_01505 [Candidatus Woesearchaeota archaeon]